MLEWLLPKAEHFPRVYRFTVTQRMLDSALDFQDSLFEAQSKQGESRLLSLQQCDAALSRLRLYLRLAFQWQWLNSKQYRHISEMVAELGRLLGGWMKQAKR